MLILGLGTFTNFVYLLTKYTTSTIRYHFRFAKKKHSTRPDKDSSKYNGLDEICCRTYDAANVDIDIVPFCTEVNAATELFRPSAPFLQHISHYLHRMQRPLYTVSKQVSKSFIITPAASWLNCTM